MSLHPPCPLPEPRPGRSAPAGFTLIETLGAMAILTLIVVALSSAALARYTALARQNESDTLYELAESLRRSATIELVIPSQTNFAAQVARFSGVSAAAVLTNAQGNPRLLLIDSSITNSGWDVPFRQVTNALAGAGAGELRGLRMMLVSSVGRPFTNGLPAAPGGKITTAVFSNFWVTAKGSLPAGVTWDGDPYDLCLQRVQFLDLFHPVSLNHAEITGPHTNGQVRLTGMTGFARPLGAPLPHSRWYLQGTTLSLSNAADGAVLSEIVREPVTFTYEMGFWVRDSQGLTTASSRLSRLSGADFEWAVEQFLAASTQSGGNNPGDQTTARNVVNAMSNYIAWGAKGPASTNLQKMGQYQTVMRSELLDYTDLPSGQFNKP